MELFPCYVSMSFRLRQLVSFMQADGCKRSAERCRHRVGRGAERMVSGLHTSVTSVPCSQQSSGAFWHFGFFSVQLLNPRFCFVHYCSYTFHCKLFSPCAKNRSLEKILSRFCNDDQILVLEVISSLSSDGADEPCVARQSQVWK